MERRLLQYNIGDNTTLEFILCFVVRFKLFLWLYDSMSFIYAAQVSDVTALLLFDSQGFLSVGCLPAVL